jgi:hypothetical protein
VSPDGQDEMEAIHLVVPLQINKFLGAQKPDAQRLARVFRYCAGGGLVTPLSRLLIHALLRSISARAAAVDASFSSWFCVPSEQGGAGSQVRCLTQAHSDPPSLMSWVWHHFLCCLLVGVGGKVDLFEALLGWTAGQFAVFVASAAS